MKGQLWPRGAVRMAARNQTTGRLLAEAIGVAATRVERAIGLLGRASLPPGEGLWIVPSRGVHTWGMRFAIDVLALDARGIVLDAVSRMRPWRMRLPRRGTAGVLELPAGSLEASDTRVGHQVTFEITSGQGPVVGGRQDSGRWAVGSGQSEPGTQEPHRGTQAP